MINRDMFNKSGNTTENPLFRDPFYSEHRVKMNPNGIRNNTAHSTLLFKDPYEDYEVDKYKGQNIVVLSAKDLEMDTYKLMQQVREILLNLQLAINSKDFKKKSNKT